MSIQVNSTKAKLTLALTKQLETLHTIKIDAVKYLAPRSIYQGTMYERDIPTLTHDEDEGGYFTTMENTRMMVVSLTHFIPEIEATSYNHGYNAQYKNKRVVLRVEQNEEGLQAAILWVKQRIAQARRIKREFDAKHLEIVNKWENN